jgi:hypothetical protein
VAKKICNGTKLDVLDLGYGDFSSSRCLDFGVIKPISSHRLLRIDRLSPHNASRDCANGRIDRASLGQLRVRCGMPKCLITGGAGFTGTHLVGRLSLTEAELVVIDNFNAYYSRDEKLANINPCVLSGR